MTTILEQFLRDGDRLFRWRSHFPLVLVPVLVGGVFLEHQPFGTVGVERAWEVFSVLVALAGLAIRAWAVGTAPAGTSERSTVNPRASELRTTGLYSMVRHPLYLGNGLMALGIALFPGVWYLPLVVVMGTMLYYERIAAREEQFLDGQFGAAFHEWASRVPAIVPRLAGRIPSTTSMSWRKILRGEFYGLLVITASVFVLDLAQAWSRSRTFRPDPIWTWVFVATAGMFLVVRTLKKSTRRLDTGD
jgi:protein-S-isoprenylcysteine O-methyltransferase Ste14